MDADPAGNSILFNLLLLLFFTLLNAFFAGAEMARALFARHALSLNVIEGVMGYYDGLRMDSAEASSWDVARALEAPAVLVVDGCGMALSAAAGPASNLLLAWVSMILYKLCWYSGLGDAVPVLTMFLYYMVAMNLSLAVFNLLPVPPFDGSRIALLFLPQRLYFRAMKYERYIMLAVLALVFLGLLDAPLSWLVNGMWRLMLHLTGFVELLWGY